MKDFKNVFLWLYECGLFGMRRGAVAGFWFGMIFLFIGCIPGLVLGAIGGLAGGIVGGLLHQLMGKVRGLYVGWGIGGLVGGALASGLLGGCWMLTWDGICTWLAIPGAIGAWSALHSGKNAPVLEPLQPSPIPLSGRPTLIRLPSGEGAGNALMGDALGGNPELFGH